MIRQPPRSTLFPSPTLFRSLGEVALAVVRVVDRLVALVGELVRQPEAPAGIVLGERAVAERVLHAGPARGRRCRLGVLGPLIRDRKSTRLNSSHANISYAVF